MDVTRCPHCEIHVAPTANGECPSCRHSIAAPPANIADDNERREIADSQLVESDPTRQFRTLCLLLGGLWLIEGVRLIMFGYAVSFKLPFAAVWGLVSVGIGLLICLKRVWAVRVALGISYWLILHSILIVHGFPGWPQILAVLLGHGVLNRVAKMRAYHERPAKKSCTDE